MEKEERIMLQKVLVLCSILIFLAVILNNCQGSSMHGIDTVEVNSNLVIEEAPNVLYKIHYETDSISHMKYHF